MKYAWHIRYRTYARKEQALSLRLSGGAERRGRTYVVSGERGGGCRWWGELGRVVETNDYPEDQLRRRSGMLRTTVIGGCKVDLFQLAQTR